MGDDTNAHDELRSEHRAGEQSLGCQRADRGGVARLYLQSRQDSFRRAIRARDGSAGMAGAALRYRLSGARFA